jgi:hypothetical protein
MRSADHGSLSQRNSIGTGTEIAHELLIGEPARSGEVAAGNRADRIIVTRPGSTQARSSM